MEETTASRAADHYHRPCRPAQHGGLARQDRQQPVEDPALVAFHLDAGCPGRICAMWLAPFTGLERHLNSGQPQQGPRDSVAALLIRDRVIEDAADRLLHRDRLEILLAGWGGPGGPVVRPGWHRQHPKDVGPVLTGREPRGRVNRGTDQRFEGACMELSDPERL